MSVVIVILTLQLSSFCVQGCPGRRRRCTRTLARVQDKSYLVGSSVEVARALEQMVAERYPSVDIAERRPDFASAADVEFSHDAVQVGFDRSDAQHELVGDLLV